MTIFDEREQQLISNCCAYAANEPAGLPGHNLMIIVAKMKAQMEEQEHLARKGVEYLQIEEYVSGIWELVNKNQKVFGNPPAGSNVMKLALDKLNQLVQEETPVKAS